MNVCTEENIAAVCKKTSNCQFVGGRNNWGLIRRDEDPIVWSYVPCGETIDLLQTRFSNKLSKKMYLSVGPSGSAI